MRFSQKKLTRLNISVKKISKIAWAGRGIEPRTLRFSCLYVVPIRLIAFNSEVPAPHGFD